MTWRSILNNPITNDQEYKENKEYRKSPKSYIPDITYITGRNTKEEILDHAEYLFFERLGISNNEELSIKEALSYIDNQLILPKT